MKELINKSIQVYNTVESHRLPSDFLGRYHIHVLCHAGKAQFSFMGNTYTMEAGDWVIWQMSSLISMPISCWLTRISCWSLIQKGCGLPRLSSSSRRTPCSILTKGARL